MLENDVKEFKNELDELLLFSRKRKLLSKLMDEVMVGAKNLPSSELVELGRKLKEGRFAKLKGMGLL